MSGQLSIVKKPTTKCFVIQDQQIYMTILNQPIFISTYMLSTKKILVAAFLDYYLNGWQNWLCW